MRVLIVLPGLAGNGISRHVLDLATELQPLGVDSEIFTIRPLELGELPHADAPPLRMTSGNLPPSRRYRYRVPALGARLYRAARWSDVVYAGWEVGQPLVAAYLAARAARRPLLTTVQSFAAAELDHYTRGWANSATRWIYPRVDAVVCVSDGLIPVVADLGVSPDRVQVIPVGIQVERTRRLASEPPPDWMPEGPFVVGLGRLAHAKAFDVLLEAHARVRQAGLTHRLVIMGEGEEREALEALAQRLNVSDTVFMPGFVRNPFPVLAHASALAAPSRFEGWGLMVAEAVTLGVPVISSELPGTRDILGGGLYGELIDKASVDALESALVRHLRDRGPLLSKAESARAHADSFAVRGRARRYARLFEEMVSRERHGLSPPEAH